MGTEILLPQDCLIERIRVPPASFYRRRPYGNCYNNNNYGNSNNFYGANSGRINRKPAIRPEQRKRVAVTEKKPSSDDLKVARGSSLVTEKVTILRRGESLDSKMNTVGLKKEGEDLVVIGTQRLRSDPNFVHKQIRIVDFKNGCDIYAGSAFAMSPSPSALPIPSFQRKLTSSVAVDDSATRDLRRLLRIE
ncbi:uncharacterized protein [Cicer arietinum]|uniref:Uncharacterized protein LOC101505806 n=1 Tax=Cicer arietinum TaxID=3827 RepID=A0A1S2XA60_CICAR|nr:uncharacterized protein LOC101505806 [Cicer arietinum]